MGCESAGLREALLTLQKKQAAGSGDEIVSIQVYKKRWYILLLATLYLVAVGYNRACFGVVDNVYANYYEVETEIVDWLTHTMSAVSVIGCLYILCILPLKDFGFRTYCLVTSCAIVVSYACHLGASFQSQLFPISVVGQVSMGVVNTLSIILVPVVAALWFPKEEVATAVGISLGGIDIGNMLGFNVPSFFLHNFGNTTEAEWKYMVKRNMVGIFSACFVFGVAVLVATYVIVEDRPCVPPSLSEAAKRKFFTGDMFVMESTPSRVVYYLKMICYDRIFLALVVCFGLVETCYMLEVLMMSDMLRKNHPDLSGKELDTQSNVLAGHILTVYAAGGFVGGIVSGLLIDKTKRFKTIAVISGFCMVIWSIGFLVSVVENNMPVAYLTNAFYGFFNGACYTALYEIIVQHMYPCNELAQGAWIAFFVSATGLTVPLIGRLTFNHLSDVGVLGFQSGVLLLATVIITVLQPRYERLSVNQSQESMLPLPQTPACRSLEHD